MLYEILQPIWHYIKCVIVKRNEIGIIKKKKFYSFGKKSIIMKPYLQLSGIENVSIGKGTTILDGCRLSVYGNGEDDIIIIELGSDTTSKRRLEAIANTLPSEVNAKLTPGRDSCTLRMDRKPLEALLGFKFRRFLFF